MPDQDELEYPPEFLDGTFNWRINGLFFDSPPPLDLLAPAALTDRDPWIVVAAVLARAQAGDHSQIKRLERYFSADEPFAINRIALLLVGDAGGERDLRMLEQVLRGDDEEARVYAAEAARLAGRLWLVPAMLDAWWRAEDMADRETIGFAISDLLEPEPDGGPIAEAAPARYAEPKVAEEKLSPAAKRVLDTFRSMDFGPPPFPNLVGEAMARVSAELGDERAVVWGGGLFDVTAFARQFLALAPTIAPGMCLVYRHKFEAATGWNCTRFFRDDAIQRLEVQATLEEFLESDPQTVYLPGVRYFFGHRIPD